MLAVTSLPAVSALASGRPCLGLRYLNHCDGGFNAQVHKNALMGPADFETSQIAGRTQWDHPELRTSAKAISAPSGISVAVVVKPMPQAFQSKTLVKEPKKFRLRLDSGNLFHGVAVAAYAILGRARNQPFHGCQPLELMPLHSWVPRHPGTCTAVASVVVIIVVSIMVVSIMVVVIPMVVFIMVVMVVVVSLPLAMLNPCSFPQLPPLCPRLFGSLHLVNQRETHVPLTRLELRRCAASSEDFRCPLRALPASERLSRHAARMPSAGCRLPL